MDSLHKTMKIKDMFNNLKQKTKINVVKGLAALVFAASGLTGCGDILDPLGTKINGVTTAPSSYVFSGQNAEIKFKPSEKPYQKVEGAYQRPGEDWTSYQELTADNNSEYNLDISSTPSPGDYKAKFRTTCGLTSKESDEETIPVYMNEAQSDSALEEAINEIGVNPLTTTKGEIKTFDKNFNGYGGRPDLYVDGFLDIRYIPVDPSRYHGIIVQGSNSDTQTANQGAIDLYHGNGDGCIFIPPVKSKDEIKNKILQEKNSTTPHNWPDIDNWL